MEAVRRRAVQRVLNGRTRAAVAVTLGIHGVTAAKWMAGRRVAGDPGLAAKPTPGRPRFLTPEQDRRVRQWPARKPTAHGFPTDLRTARRVAELIRRALGIAFHPNYLRARLTRRGYSPQRPTRRPRQRNDAVIDRLIQRKFDPDLLRALWNRCKLPFPTKKKQ